MKQTLIALALVPFLTAPALAAAVATPLEPVTSDGVESLRARFNKAVEQLREAAKERNATRADYQRVLDALTAAAEAYEAETQPAISARRRLDMRVRDLEATPREMADAMDELKVLEDIAIDVELEYLRARLQSRAIAGNWSRADYQAMVDALAARLASAKPWNPQIEPIVARVRAYLTELDTRAKDPEVKLTEADFKPLGHLLSEARISQVIARLERRGLEKKAVKADYDDVDEAVKLLEGPDLAEFQRRVKERLEEIRKAVQADRITRDEFVALRDMMTTRAREASFQR